MSILPICSIAAITRCDVSASVSVSSSWRRRGVTCHDTPKRSFTQPHGPGRPRPPQAEAPLPPPPGPGPPAVAELLPVVVDLILVGTLDLEGDRLVERELRAAVERDERRAVELEGHRHDAAGVARAGLAV